MRLSDLLGAEVVDVDGLAIGQVHDVRLVQDGPLQGTFGAGLRVVGLLVGPMAVASRLGYERRRMHGPWAVAALARHLNRHVAYVPWETITDAHDRIFTLSVAATDLGPPPLSSDGRIET
jgi:sporulation protein YlmC with PRC-barrel domain